MKKLKLLLTTLMLICFGVGSWAAELTIDFESATSAYTDWTFSNFQTQQTNSNVTAHGGSYFGTTGGKTNGSVTTVNKIASPQSITFYYSKTSTNTTASSWIIQVSSDGSTWTNVDSKSASSGVTRGTWYEFTHSLTDYSNVYVRIYYDGTTAVRCLDDVVLSYSTTTPTVSVEQNGSAITELNFGEQEPAAGYVKKTFDLKASNLTGNVYLEPSNTITYKIDAENYPNGLAYLTVKPTNGSIDTTITILASTLNSGTYNATLSLTSTKETPEFSAVSLDLKLKVLGPEITLKDNSTSEPINEIDFGNVGKNRSKSAQFAFGYQRMETGELTITVSDDFEFSGGKQTESYDITSASGTTYYVSIYKKTTTVKNITDGWIKFTGCGLPSEGVFYDVKMNVKEPKVSIDITSDQDHPYNFGNIKQHEVCSDCGSDYAMKTIHITGEYLGSDIFTAEWGSIYDLSPSRIYVDEDGMVDQDLNVYIYTGTAGTYAYDRTDDNKGWKMRIYSGAVTPEFEEIEIYPSVTIVPTYGVNFQVYDNDRGTITINGIESSSNGKVTAYVVDDNEEITMVATPKLGWKFTEWQVDNADKANVAIDDDKSAYTYAYVSAETKGYITAMFEYDCKPLARPSAAASLSETYNSANLKWQWVWEGENKAATYHLHAFETENPSMEIDEDITFTSTDLEESTLYYTLTGLKGATDYTVQVWGTSVADAYCATGYVAEFTLTTENYPDATLTLSENGKESAFGSNLKVADVVTLPSTVTKEVVGKVFVGWSSETIATPTDTKPGAATYWEKGASYTIQSTADKLYAVYATETAMPATSHNVFEASSLGNTNTVTENFSISVQTLTPKDGWYQESGSAGDYNWIKITDNDHQIIQEQPSSIKLTAKVGAGSAKETLTNPVYALLLNGSNIQLGEEVILTQTIPDKNGTEFTVTLPTTYYDDIRGIDIYHVKEMNGASGYNLRYYTIKLEYLTGGEPIYSGYVTQGAGVLEEPTFSPAEGTYKTAQNISLSADKGDIYYTINGEDPTSASTKYTAAIALNEYGTYTIKAMAIDGENMSKVASKTYFINLPFASLKDLVDANLPAAGTNDVTVSFSGIAIDSIKNNNKSVYLHVLDIDGEKDIYIYFGAEGCPSTWAVGGSLSGTITGKWLKYSSNEWEIVPNSGFAWTDLTYSAPAPSLSLSKSSIDFGTVAKGTSISEDAMKIEMIGANLTGDVTVTAATEGSTSIFSTNGFKPSVTFYQENGSIDANVLAIPTTSKIGNFTGSLTFHSKTSDFEDKVVSLHIQVTSASGIAWAAAKDTTYTVGLKRTPQTLTNPHNLTVSYSSSDETVATIDSEGKISPLKQGTTTIKASFAGNDDYEAAEASYVLQVWAPKAIIIDGEQKKTSFEYGDYFNPATDGEYVVKAVYGDDVPYIYYDVTSEASWLLDDVDIATKQITGNGSMALTAKWKGLSESVDINVTVKKQIEPNLAWSATSADVRYGASNTYPTLSKPEGLAVEYSSSDPSIATINAETGVISLKANGTTTITAASKATEDYFADEASYTLNVSAGIVTVTPSPLALDLGDVIYKDEQLTKYKQTFHLHIENLALGKYNQVVLDFEGEDFYAFGVDGDTYITGYNEEGIIDKDINIIPSSFGMSYPFAQVGGKRTASIKITQTGSPVQMPSTIIGTVTMNIIAVCAITVQAENGTITFNGEAAPEVAQAGTKFTLVANPASGYKADGITVLNASNESDVTADVLDGDILTMPTFAIKVIASFSEDKETAMDEVEAELNARKILRDGNLFILRGGKIYDAAGLLVK